MVGIKRWGGNGEWAWVTQSHNQSIASSAFISMPLVRIKLSRTIITVIHATCMMMYVSNNVCVNGKSINNLVTLGPTY